MNPGKFLNIPADEYHAESRNGHYMSSHNLAAFRESPELYRRKTSGEIAESESPALALGRAQFSAVCQVAGVPSPRDTAELHNRTLVLSVRCKRRKDTDELENVISGYKPKEAAAQTAAPVQQHPQGHTRPLEGPGDGTDEVRPQ